MQSPLQSRVALRCHALGAPNPGDTVAGCAGEDTLPIGLFTVEWYSNAPQIVIGYYSSEVEVHSKRLVELFCELEAERTNHFAEPFDRDGPNLLGLRFGIDIESGLVGR